MILCIFQGYSLNLSHSLLPSLCPHIHFPHQCLFSCSAHRYISTIFLDSIYKRYCCLLAKLCPTPWDAMDCSLPGSSVHGISQARSHFFLQGILLTQGLNPHHLLAGRFFTTEAPGKPIYALMYNICLPLSDFWLARISSLKFLWPSLLSLFLLSLS